MEANRKPRVGMISPYWSFFSNSAPGFREEYRQRIEVASRVIAESADIRAAVVLSEDDDPDVVVRELRQAKIDVRVVVSTMVAPLGMLLRVLESFLGLPLVVWAARRSGSVAAGAFTHSDIVRDGATVGAPQITSVLVRTERAFGFAATSLDDASELKRVADAICAAGTAARLRAARIGRIGQPIPGYDCVDADQDRLKSDISRPVDSGLDVNPWWPESLCLRSTPRVGSGTVVGFTQLAKAHRFIAANGRLTKSPYAGVGTTHAAFVFDAASQMDAWERWCRAGVNHHSSLTPGAIADLVVAVSSRHRSRGHLITFAI